MFVFSSKNKAKWKNVSANGIRKTNLIQRAYSALHKYWNSKDRIALLAVESRHLQIWLKDEYETKLQSATFYY